MDRCHLKIEAYKLGGTLSKPEGKFYVTVICSAEPDVRAPLGGFPTEAERDAWVREFRKELRKLNSKLGLSSEGRITATFEFSPQMSRPMSGSRVASGWTPARTAQYYKNQFERSAA